MIFHSYLNFPNGTFLWSWTNHDSEWLTFAKMVMTCLHQSLRYSACCDCSNQTDLEIHSSLYWPEKFKARFGYIYIYVVTLTIPIISSEFVIIYSGPRCFLFWLMPTMMSFCQKKWYLKNNNKITSSRCFPIVVTNAGAYSCLSTSHWQLEHLWSSIQFNARFL